MHINHNDFNLSIEFGRLMFCFSQRVIYSKQWDCTRLKKKRRAYFAMSSIVSSTKPYLLSLTYEFCKNNICHQMHCDTWEKQHNVGTNSFWRNISASNYKDDNFASANRTSYYLHWNRMLDVLQLIANFHSGYSEGKKIIHSNPNLNMNNLRSIILSVPWGQQNWLSWGCFNSCIIDQNESVYNENSCVFFLSSRCVSVNDATVTQKLSLSLPVWMNEN